MYIRRHIHRKVHLRVYIGKHIHRVVYTRVCTVVYIQGGVYPGCVGDIYTRVYPPRKRRRHIYPGIPTQEAGEASQDLIDLPGG